MNVRELGRGEYSIKRWGISAANCFDFDVDKLFSYERSMCAACGRCVIKIQEYKLARVIIAEYSQFKRFIEFRIINLAFCLTSSFSAAEQKFSEAATCCLPNHLKREYSDIHFPHLDMMDIDSFPLSCTLRKRTLLNNLLAPRQTHWCGSSLISKLPLITFKFLINLCSLAKTMSTTVASFTFVFQFSQPISFIRKVSHKPGMELW